MKKAMAVLAISVSLGALTAYAHGWLPFALAMLANSAAPWCLVAFACGAATQRRSPAGWYGALCLLGLVAGYYGVNELVRGYPASTTYVAFWSLAAFVAGPLRALWAWLAANRLRSPGLRLASGPLGGLLVVLLYVGYSWSHDFVVSVLAAVAA